MDRKGRTLQLSIRAKDEDELADTLEDYQSHLRAARPSWARC
jgi:small subunit ribosomal protein S1